MSAIGDWMLAGV